MRITRNVFVLFACGSLLAACGGEKKKNEGNEAEKVAEQGQEAATPASPTPAATAPSKPFGKKLAGLLGGGKADAEEGGLLGGLGLGDLGEQMGDVGAGGLAPAVAAEQGGAPAATPAAGSAATAAKGGQCGALADHLMQIMKKEVASGMADVPPELAAELEKQLAGAKGQIVAECEKSNWPPAVHQCILKAADMNSLMQCESMVGGGAAAAAEDPGDVDWKDLDMSDIPTEVQSSGDAECDRLAEHVFKVMAGAADPEEREMVETMKAVVMTELSKQCASTPWPKAARTCILQAGSESAMEQCASKHGLE